MVQLTRLVAMVLKDDSVRLALHHELHASPYREHKLVFRAFTDQTRTGTKLLAAMHSRQAARSLASVKALRDTAVELELYMPVGEHFAAWTGDENVLVATAFDIDRDQPVAFNINGDRIMLASPEVAPSMPTLALVRAEGIEPRAP